MTDDPASHKDPDDSTYSESNDDSKHQKSKPPSVTGEEDHFSGDVPVSGEDYDIDEELEKVGLHGGVKPLDVADELQEEEK